MTILKLEDMTQQQLEHLYAHNTVLRNLVAEGVIADTTQEIHAQFAHAMDTMRDWRVGYDVHIGFKLGEPGKLTEAMMGIAEDLTLTDELEDALAAARVAYDAYRSADMYTDEFDEAEHTFKFRERNLAARLAGEFEAMYRRCDDPQVQRDYMVDEWAPSIGWAYYVELESDGGFNPVMYRTESYL